MIDLIDGNIRNVRLTSENKLNNLTKGVTKLMRRANMCSENMEFGGGLTLSLWLADKFAQKSCLIGTFGQ